MKTIKLAELRPIRTQYSTDAGRMNQLQAV